MLVWVIFEQKKKKKNNIFWHAFDEPKTIMKASK